MEKKASSPGLEMSSEDLKRRLYQTFRNKGWEDSLKAQLRKKLVIELQHDALLKTESPTESVVQAKGDGSLILRAANSLIADHLRRCQYDYSLSVFLPESGISKDKMFSIPDILDLLHIPPGTPIYKKLAHDLPSYSSKGIFWHLLCEVAQAGNRQSAEKSIQVNETPEYRSSIEQKLSAVDQHFDSVMVEGKVSGEFGIEERLLKIQRQAETRAKEELANQMLQFKTNELKRMQLEEREKCREEIAKARKDMERTYQVKIEAVQERERHASERVRTQQQMMERETYSQRQNLLEELRVLRQKEADLKREAEVNARAAKMEEDKRKAIEDNLKFRESAVNDIENTYDRKLKEEVKRIELDFEIKWTKKLHGLDKKEKQIKDEKREIFEERLSMKTIGEQLREKNERAEELEQQVKQLRTEIISETHKNQMMSEKLRNVVDYPSLKEGNAVLRKELENTQMRLAETLSEQKAEKTRNEELLKQLTERMSRPSPELISLRGELERTRDKLQQEKATTQQKEEHWKLKVQEESQRSSNMQNQLEEQSKQMREMVNEINGLRRMLQQTQTALRNEVYRQDADRNGTAPPQGRSIYAGGEIAEDLYTSFRKSHLETQLGLADYNRYESRLDSSGETESNETSQVGGSLSFVEETKARMRQLEQEAELLERNYQEFQQRMREPVRHPTSSPYHGHNQSQFRSSSGPTADPSQISYHQAPVIPNDPPTRNGDNDTFKGLMVQHRYLEPKWLPSPSEGDWLTRQKPTIHQDNSQFVNSRDIPTEDQYIPSTTTPTEAMVQPSPCQRSNELPVSSIQQREVFPSPDHPPDQMKSKDVPSYRQTEPENPTQKFPTVSTNPHYPSQSSSTIDAPVPNTINSKMGVANITPSVIQEENNQSKATSQQVSQLAYANQISKGQSKEDEAERRRLEEEREQREWEEQRRKKEEERKRREEEAREKERQMLLQLQQEEQQEEDDIQPTKDEPEQEKSEEKPKADDKTDGGGHDIDPLMQRYMAMVQQKRQQDGGKENIQPQKQESVSSDHISQGSLSADDLEANDDHNSVVAFSDGDDPFDDW